MTLENGKFAAEITHTDILLSVIVPNYNHAKYLTTAIEAILAQRRVPDEIIVIDDGSTDQSKSLIQELACREPTIRTIFNPTNLGAIRSINIGLQAARGRYVCLMAADDRSYPNFFSLALDALDKYPLASLFCAEAHVQLMDNSIHRRGVRPAMRPSHRLMAFNPGETRHLLRHNDSFITPLATVFRKDLLLAEGGLDPGLGSMADGYLSKRLALKYGFCFSPTTVTVWQIRQDGLSRRSSGDPKAVLSMLEEAQKRIATDPVFPPDYSTTFERRWRFATCRVALVAKSPDWHFLREIGPDGKIDRLVLSVARRCPPRFGSYLALIWLTLRYRPYSLFGIADTFVRRQWERKMHDGE